MLLHIVIRRGGLWIIVVSVSSSNVVLGKSLSSNRHSVMVMLMVVSVLNRPWEVGENPTRSRHRNRSRLSTEPLLHSGKALRITAVSRETCLDFLNLTPGSGVELAVSYTPVPLSEETT